MAGQGESLWSTDTTLLVFTGGPAPEGPPFWDVWEEIAGGHVCEL